MILVSLKQLRKVLLLLKTTSGARKTTWRSVHRLSCYITHIQKQKLTLRIIYDKPKFTGPLFVAAEVLPVQQSH